MVKAIWLPAILGLSVVFMVAFGIAGTRMSPPHGARPEPVSIDFELTAECLAEHQSWRNFNSTLADLERDLRFCIDVWSAAQLSAAPSPRR